MNTRDQGTAVSVGDLEHDPEAWAELINTAQMTFGGMDLLCFGNDTEFERVSCFSLFAAFAKRATDDSFFSHVVVVLPPSLALGQTEDAVRTKLSSGSALLTISVSPNLRANDVRQRVTHTFAPSLTTEGLLAAISVSTPGSIVLVVAAASYRDPKIQSVSGSDGWVAHLVQAARVLEPIVTSKRVMVLFDSGRLVPSDKGLALLNESCLVTVCGFTGQAVPFDARLEQLFSRDGLEPVLAELDSIVGLQEWKRSMLKARYYARADRMWESFGVCVPQMSDILKHGSGEALAEIARIAVGAGQYLEATAIVRRIDPERVMEIESLDLLVALAQSCGLGDLRDTLRARVIWLFPGTPVALRTQVDALLQKQSFSEITRLLGENTESTLMDERLSSVEMIAAALSETPPNYDALLRAATERTPACLPAALALSIRHAISRGAIDEALRLASEPLLDDACAAGAVESLREYFLRGGYAPESAATPILRPLERVVEYLAARPYRSRVRSALSSLLSPRTSGVIGAAALAIMLRKRFASSLVLTPASDDPQPSTPEELMNFHERLVSGLPKGSARFAGADALPPELAKEDLPRVLSGYMHVVSYLATNEIVSTDDVDIVSQYLFAGLIVAKATRTEGAIADLIALVGGGLARFGYFQGARDLAEHVLSMTDDGSSGVEKRNAWRCYADLYQRVQNPIEALLGMTCAAFADNGEHGLAPSQFWNDVTTVVKTFRELGAVDEARGTLWSVRVFLESVGEFESVRARWEFLRCSMVLDSIAEADGVAKTEVAMGFAIDMTKLIEDAIERKSDLVPVVGLAAQVVSRVDVIAPEGAGLLRAAIMKATRYVSEGQRRAIEVFMPGRLEAVLVRFSGNRTRDSEDLATDLRALSIAARSSLSRACDSRDLLAGLLSVECVAFHGATVEVRDQTSVRGAEWPFRHRDQERPGLAPVTDMLVTSEEAAAAIVRGIVDGGTDVHAVGIDAGGRAVRVSFYSDRAPEIRREEPSVLSPEALRRWARRYPKGYAEVSRSDPFGDEVVETVAKLGVSCPLGRNEIALLLDADLQVLPANLLRVGDTLCGANAPTISIPSLSWLRLPEKCDPEAHRRVAWFGDGAEREVGALQVLREDIEPVLQQNGFDITGGTPTRIHNAEIVLFGAHGGIFDESASGIAAFRQLSDERALRLSIEELCDLVEPCKVVILFVCSAGRLDDMPFSQGLWGAPAALLRRGCRAVVASPWPLDVAVPGKWLPTFLDRLVAGDTVNRATFEANHAVHAREPHPSRWLAMHLYGDPRTRIDVKR